MSASQETLRQRAAYGVASANQETWRVANLPKKLRQEEEATWLAVGGVGLGSLMVVVPIIDNAVRKKQRTLFFWVVVALGVLFIILGIQFWFTQRSKTAALKQELIANNLQPL